jgi:hypothetical protein
MHIANLSCFIFFIFEKKRLCSDFKRKFRILLKTNVHDSRVTADIPTLQNDHEIFKSQDASWSYRLLLVIVTTFSHLCVFSSVNVL